MVAEVNMKNTGGVDLTVVSNEKQDKEIKKSNIVVFPTTEQEVGDTINNKAETIMADISNETQPENKNSKANIALGAALPVVGGVLFGPLGMLGGSIAGLAVSLGLFKGDK